MYSIGGGIKFFRRVYFSEVDSLGRITFIVLEGRYSDGSRFIFLFCVGNDF